MKGTHGYTTYIILIVKNMIGEHNHVFKSSEIAEIAIMNDTNNPEKSNITLVAVTSKAYISDAEAFRCRLWVYNHIM